MDVGMVGCLRRVKSVICIAVARAVMDHTQHTLMVGYLATKFALEMGFSETNQLGKDYLTNNCQPNFSDVEKVTPDPCQHCGPYIPQTMENTEDPPNFWSNPPTDTGLDVNVDNHDTVGMIAIDRSRNVIAGTSINGLTFKIPRRVGDSPIMGAGSYAMNGAGAAAATRNDSTLSQMLSGADHNTALQRVMAPIIKYYPSLRGAMIAVKMKGKYDLYMYLDANTV